MNNTKRLCKKISSYIKHDFIRLDLRDKLTSTNTELRKIAASGEPEGYALAALMQTGGRGRTGKSFYSPLGGIYLSILLRPKNFDLLAKSLTPCAAVAVAEAVERVTGIHLGIKWVNDLFYGKRKVCGILTEVISTPSQASPEGIIVGIGVNLFESPDGFGELSGTAGALFPCSERSDELYALLTAEIINVFFEKYESLDERAIFAEYENRFILKGRDISVLKNGVAKRAKCIGINPDFSLGVTYDSDESEWLSSGEISIIPL